MICTYLFHFNPIGFLVLTPIVFFVKSLMSINDYCGLTRKIARRSGSGVCSLTSGANKNCQMTTINGFKEDLQ